MQQQQQNFGDQPQRVQREMSSYEDCLECCGSISGCMRAWLPCFCFMCPYPFVIIQQSNVGLVERFGGYSRQIESGLIQINPCTESVITVDLRTCILDLDRQSILTRDNITVRIDAVLYFRIVDAYSATYKVTQLIQSLKEMAYASLRQVCGEHILQELLDNREHVQENIEAFLDQNTGRWGIYVDEVFIKDMVLSQELQSDIATAAKNKRIAQAKIISAKADVESAKLMREAADFLDNKAAMQIRFLDTLQLIAKGNNPKVILFYSSIDYVLTIECRVHSRSSQQMID